MIYLLIFFLDERRSSLYGSPGTPSIQGITYRPILLGALSSGAGHFSVLSHPIHVVNLRERGLHEVKSPRSRKIPAIHFAGKDASGSLQPVFLPVSSGGNNHSGWWLPLPRFIGIIECKGWNPRPLPAADESQGHLPL